MSALVPTDEVRLSSQDRLLAMIRAKHPEYHPVLSMVQIALDVDHDGEDGDRALAFACHKEVAKYTVQVDRHTEIKSEIVKTRRVVVEMFSSPQQIDAQPSPVLEADVTDVDVRRTVVEDRGPVEEPEIEEHPERLSSYLEVDEPASAETGDQARHSPGFAWPELTRSGE